MLLVFSIFLCQTVLRIQWFVRAADIVQPNGIKPEHLVLAKKYAPVLRFQSVVPPQLNKYLIARSKDEIFYPSTVSFFFSNVNLLDSTGNVAKSFVTPSNLPFNLTDEGRGYFLSVNSIADSKLPGGFLRGMRVEECEMYTFVVEKKGLQGEKVVDLIYWLFTPFNQGKYVTAYKFGQVGDRT